jgi:hypothetical protein
MTEKDAKNMMHRQLVHAESTVTDTIRDFQNQVGQDLFSALRRNAEDAIKATVKQPLLVKALAMIENHQGPLDDLLTALQAEADTYLDTALNGAKFFSRSTNPYADLISEHKKHALFDLAADLSQLIYTARHMRKDQTS